MVASRQKSSTIEFEIAELIKNRKSIRAFGDKPIEKEKIQSLFEAIRWAPSSTNEQPWKYLYATREQSELWGKFFDALNDGNKTWVKNAPLLIFSLAKKTLTRYSGLNTYAMYDLGGANSFLALQAVELGLQVRQMAGYDYATAKANLNIPDDYELGVFIAVGYPGDVEQLPESLKSRELAPRERYLQHEFSINGTFQ
jgi:nitroreductase